ncbi:MAG: hypothetical protein HFJ75_02380 [Eggerthellaceae bacterium]|nr:hypothetical protein [Eggerthellaceae bacterium]
MDEFGDGVPPMPKGDGLENAELVETDENGEHIFWQRLKDGTKMDEDDVVFADNFDPFEKVESGEAQSDYYDLSILEEKAEHERDKEASLSFYDLPNECRINPLTGEELAQEEAAAESRHIYDGTAQIEYETKLYEIEQKERFAEMDAAMGVGRREVERLTRELDDLDETTLDELSSLLDEGRGGSDLPNGPLLGSDDAVLLGLEDILEEEDPADAEMKAFEDAIANNDVDALLDMLPTLEDEPESLDVAQGSDMDSEVPVDDLDEPQWDDPVDTDEFMANWSAQLDAEWEAEPVPSHFADGGE